MSRLNEVFAKLDNLQQQINELTTQLDSIKNKDTNRKAQIKELCASDPPEDLKITPEEVYDSDGETLTADSDG